ncbi:MAG: biopolymer transporter ExbD [bacterium]|nr:biopolymer transporter ExbD [bacterium]
MQRKWHRKRRSPGINITALVDCIILLLIFFVVTSNIAREGSSMKLQLPHSQAREARPHQAVKIVLPADGSVLVEGERVAVKDTGKRAAAIAGGDRSVPILICADRSVPVERAIAVMDEIRLAGMSQVALATINGADK